MEQAVSGHLARMKHRGIAKAGTGLAAGAVLTAPLLGIFILGSLASIPSVPFTIFEWLIRVLPGRLVIFGLDLTVRALEGLGFNIKNTAKTAEQLLALISLFAAGLVIGLLFFSLVRRGDAVRIRRYGLGVGAVVGIFSLVIVLIQEPPSSVAAKVGVAIWVLGLFLLWGWGICRLYVASFTPADLAISETQEAAETFSTATGAPSAISVARARDLTPRVGEPTPALPEGGPRGTVHAEARAISRRRFIIQVGGLVATVVVVGAGVAEILRAESGPKTQPLVKAPIPFPNADSPVQPVPGTRPEYTAVADHYRIDIDLTAPEIDPAEWRLSVDGLVDTPLLLGIDEIKTAYRSLDQFVTLSCISNPVGGPLIGTTLWTGASFRDILATAKPQAGALYAHLVSKDGFDEELDLMTINSDPRIMLTYAWNGQPLTPPHGFPLRLYVPDRYGMKQPKWITGITLVTDSTPGYWVARDWDPKAEMRTTSVIDTVATDALDMRGGRTYVPIGGIAHAGAKGISKVEVQVDDGSWEAAELRAPLSGLTWVIWRYEWPFAEGGHRFRVRAYDGQGRLQETRDNPSFPSGATGIYEKQVEILPIKL